jgi:hypothetical protein
MSSDQNFVNNYRKTIINMSASVLIQYKTEDK